MRLSDGFGGSFWLLTILRPVRCSEHRAGRSAQRTRRNIPCETQRRRSREFLLKFAIDRDGYRARLREHWPQFAVALLDYCITSNHVHLLLDAEERA